MGTRPLRIRFDKVNGFIKIYDGMRYLVLYIIKDVMQFKAKKVVLHIALIIILQESELIHIILYL